MFSTQDGHPKGVFGTWGQQCITSVFSTWNLICLSFFFLFSRLHLKAAALPPPPGCLSVGRGGLRRTDDDSPFSTKTHHVKRKVDKKVDTDSKLNEGGENYKHSSQHRHYYQEQQQQQQPGVGVVSRLGRRADGQSGRRSRTATVRAGLCPPVSSPSWG